MFKKMVLVLSIYTLGFSATECEIKIQSLQKEIDFAKKHKNAGRVEALSIALKEVQEQCAQDPSFYDRKLQSKNTREQELAKVEQELEKLESQKKFMDKTEFKMKKAALKEQKDKIKKEYENLGF